MLACTTGWRCCEPDGAVRRRGRVPRDLDAPVAHCPGWTLRDLADHLGGVHQWAAHAVVAGTPDLEPEPAGRSPAALADWYRRRTPGTSSTC